MRWLFPAGVLIGLVVGGCGQQPPTPGQPRAVSIDSGQRLFTQVCAQCHGMGARGLPFLGADLKTSAFFNQSPEDEVIAMIGQGKPAAADRPAMPPNGGRLDLTPDDLRDIVAFIKSLPGGHEQTDGEHGTP